MKYVNAKDVMPPELLCEVRKYAAGKLVYVPSDEDKKPWGEASGARADYAERNLKIKARYGSGEDALLLAEEFYISPETVKKIVYSKEKNMSENNVCEYAIEQLDFESPEIVRNCHPVYGVLPETGSRSSFTNYDAKSGKITSTCFAEVTGEAEVHGERGWRVGVCWDKGAEGRETRFELIFQIKDGICRNLAVETFGKTPTVRTFIEGEAFTDAWGEDARTHLKARGFIKKSGKLIEWIHRSEYSDVVDACRVTVSGKSADTVLIINVSSADEGIITEDYVDRNGCTVLFRRFDRSDEPQSEEYLELDGERYYLKAICI